MFSIECNYFSLPCSFDCCLLRNRKLQEYQKNELSVDPIIFAFNVILFERALWPKNEIKTYRREFQQNFKYYRNISFRKYFVNRMFFPSSFVALTCLWKHHRNSYCILCLHMPHISDIHFFGWVFTVEASLKIWKAFL